MAQPGGGRLDGVRAVVTGASSGIGAAIAQAFGEAGATVLLTHRDSEREAAAVAEPIGALVAQADLATRGACEALVAEARDRLGGLDVWVNNAGADVLTGQAAEWDWEHKLDALLSVDLKGTIACSYAAGASCANRPAVGRSEHELGPREPLEWLGGEPEMFSAVKGGRAGLQQDSRAGSRPGSA